MQRHQCCNVAHALWQENGASTLVPVLGRVDQAQLAAQHHQLADQLPILQEWFGQPAVHAHHLA